MSRPDPVAPDVRLALDAFEGTLPARAIGVVLGSGLGRFSERLEPRVSIAMAEVPGFPRCRVPGHAGVLHAGRLSERDVIVFEGRVHLYEDASVAEVTFAVRLLAALGARAVVLTTAAGAVNASYAPGDIALVRDHINLTGHDPHREIPFEARDPPFAPARTHYDPVLLDRLSGLAFSLGVKFHRGVLAGVTGPSYETRAEVAALRAIGADVVSMSTVLEAMAAAGLGVPLVAVALITNRAGDPTGTSHESVLEVAEQAGPRLSDFLVTAVEELNWTL